MLSTITGVLAYMPAHAGRICRCHGAAAGQWQQHQTSVPTGTVCRQSGGKNTPDQETAHNGISLHYVIGMHPMPNGKGGSGSGLVVLLPIDTSTIVNY
jgi:hypothetical protein